MRRAPRQGQFCHHRCAGGGGRQRASQEGRIHTVWILSGEPYGTQQRQSPKFRDVPCTSVGTSNEFFVGMFLYGNPNDCRPNYGYDYDHHNILTIIFTTRSAKKAENWPRASQNGSGRDFQFVNLWMRSLQL